MRIFTDVFFQLGQKSVSVARFLQKPEAAATPCVWNAFIGMLGGTNINFNLVQTAGTIPSLIDSFWQLVMPTDESL